jgi:hypothetical protein
VADDLSTTDTPDEEEMRDPPTKTEVAREEATE